MAKKDKGAYVYSTNPDFEISDVTYGGQTTLAPEKQLLTIQRTNKGHGGKTVTLISGFIGKEEDLDALAKTLKSKCGTGGNAKEGIIIIQGDKKEKVGEILQKAGYKFKYSGG
jgi:translation initiation factor 1